MHPRPVRSLAVRLSRFTTALVVWVALAALGVDLWQHQFHLEKVLILGLGVVLAAVVAGCFTVRLLSRPLEHLHHAIGSVRAGRLEPIPIRRTGDELEYLGESFNDMILSLAASRREIRQQQELLEERIRQRTNALGEAMRRATAASQAKSDFLANMSHELRTPMTGILGMIDIVLDSSLTAEQRDQLETAQRCANSLLALLNDVLDHSRIEAGKMMLECVPFELSKVLTDCVKAHAPRAARKGIDLHCVLAPGLPEIVLGDPLRLRQIVTNVVSNAVKFTERGEVRVLAEAAAGAPDGQLDLRLSVQDSGIGISPGELQSIFESFTQADSSITRRYGGSGLGLAITRKLVELHGGGITAESALGMGSLFRLRIPLRLASPAVQRLSAAPVAGNGGAAPDSARILVVEDTPVNQKVLVTILTKHGYTADLANNGRDALEALQTRQYDLVLMDVQMPVLDGLEATRVIRNQLCLPNLPIIAMTAHAMHGDRERCLEAGMDNYLAKPVNPAQLLAGIQSLLGRHRQPVPLKVSKPPGPGLMQLESELARLNSRITRLASSDVRPSS